MYYTFDIQKKWDEKLQIKSEVYYKEDAQRTFNKNTGEYERFYYNKNYIYTDDYNTYIHYQFLKFFCLLINIVTVSVLFYIFYNIFDLNYLLTVRERIFIGIIVGLLVYFNFKNKD